MSSRSNLLLLRRLWPHVPRLHPRPEMLQLYVKVALGGITALTDSNRWRARTPKPRLPLGTFFGARLLQVQATRTRSSSVPQLTSSLPLYAPRTRIITFFLSCNSDSIPRLAAIEGECREESTILVFWIPAFTHLRFYTQALKAILVGISKGEEQGEREK